MLFCGYNDQAGVKILVGPDTIANTPSNPSLAGLSYSRDRGLSWARIGTLPPTPNCGDARCPTGLRGDPWMAADGANVLYVDLATTELNPNFGDDATSTPGSPIDGTAYAHSSNGGKSFLAPASVNFHLAAFVVGTSKGRVSVDKPSADIFMDRAVIAFDEPQPPGDLGIHFGRRWPHVSDRGQPGVRSAARHLSDRNRSTTRQAILVTHWIHCIPRESER